MRQGMFSIYASDYNGSGEDRKTLLRVYDKQRPYSSGGTTRYHYL